MTTILILIKHLFCSHPYQNNNDNSSHGAKSIFSRGYVPQSQSCRKKWSLIFTLFHKILSLYDMTVTFQVKSLMFFKTGQNFSNILLFLFFFMCFFYSKIGQLFSKICENLLLIHACGLNRYWLKIPVCICFKLNYKTNAGMLNSGLN